jgi:hypothetical protein
MDFIVSILTPMVDPMVDLDHGVMVMVMVIEVGPQWGRFQQSRNFIAKEI